MTGYRLGHHRTMHSPEAKWRVFIRMLSTMDWNEFSTLYEIGTSNSYNKAYDEYLRRYSK